MSQQQQPTTIAELGAEEALIDEWHGRRSPCRETEMDRQNETRLKSETSASRQAGVHAADRDRALMAWDWDDGGWRDGWMDWRTFEQVGASIFQHFGPRIEAVGMLLTPVLPTSSGRTQRQSEAVS